MKAVVYVSRSCLIYQTKPMNWATTIYCNDKYGRESVERKAFSVNRFSTSSKNNMKLLFERSRFHFCSKLCLTAKMRIPRRRGNMLLETSRLALDKLGLARRIKNRTGGLLEYTLRFCHLNFDIRICFPYGDSRKYNQIGDLSIYGIGFRY